MQGSDVEQPVQRLTYPISPEYVAGWDAERALAELVANAHDDDPKFTFQWSDGVLSIEDRGPGIPEEGLVLGWSSKRGPDSDRYLGQFGEGMKISCLVLARDADVGQVRVETVGYSFTPTVAQAPSLLALDARRASENPTQLLAYDFFHSRRKRGTKVTVQCSFELAERVRQRFLFLTAPGYRRPPAHGRVLAQPGGRIYIGGVLICSDEQRLFSYDFSPKAAKPALNRDRTVLDSSQVERLIAEALRHLSDPALVCRWVKAALDGGLHRSEQAFPYEPSGAQQRAMRSAARQLFAGARVTFSDGCDGDEEALLDLKDRGYEVLKAQSLPSYSQQYLFDALGVKPARAIYQKPQAKQLTEWVRRADLSGAEREVLDTAVAIVRGAFGPDAVGRCDAYERTRYEGADALAWGGFYIPSREGAIGIQRRNLQDLTTTLKVLVHEAAHRICHRRQDGSDYQDRTRGFESQLGLMAAQALLRAQRSGALPAPARASCASSRSQPAPSHHPASLTRELIAQRIDELGLSASQLADQCALSAALISQLRGERSPGAPPRLEHTRALTERLGLQWPVVHLVLLSERLWRKPYQDASGSTVSGGLARRGATRGRWRYGRTEDAQEGAGRVRGARGEEMAACIERLPDIGVAPSLIAKLQNQLDCAFDGADGSWLEPYRQLLAYAHGR